MASKRHLRENGCTHKVAYANKELAWAARRGTIDKDKKHPQVYKCPFCSKWHLGHTPERIKKIIRARERCKP
jgi:hypothetical protein